MTETRCWLTLVILLACARAASADEGMWTFDRAPLERIAARYNVQLNAQWLKHLQLSAVRTPGSCSASFVSRNGLVLTNHHCVRTCVEQISTAEKNYSQNGFLAETAEAEVRCPEMELNQLLDVADVTQRVAAATANLTGEAYSKALKGVMSEIEARCTEGERIRCDVVSLYRGGLYYTYRYRRLQDVRMVFVPEGSAAHFGGDPDNFTFPRYAFDAAFLRAYDNGRPLDSSGHHLVWSQAGPTDGEPTFVAGHPGRTNRLMTIAQLQFERDVRLMRDLIFLSEFRGYLTEFRARGAEQQRMSDPVFFSVENSFKANKYMHRSLLDPVFLIKKAASEAELKAKVDADAALSESVGKAWVEIEQALQRYRAIYDRHLMLENARGFRSTLFQIARDLVRSAHELPKPNNDRLREYADSNIPALKQKLFSKAPIHDELEIATLTFSLSKLREELGPDDPFVRQAFGARSPGDLARALVGGSTLKDMVVRKDLFDRGATAIAASTDPMIAFVRDVLDAKAREIRGQYERSVEAVISRSGERIAAARFKIYGTDTYPDATGTLRLSFGRVAGLRQDPEVAPFTTIAGAFARDTGRPPFDLPATWIKAKPRLRLEVPLNFISTNDIIGGNSGSPVVNQNGELVGLIFDGNLPSLGSAYGFDEETYRAVAVHSAAILEVLDKVYGASRIVTEVRGGR
jgi:peptidase S46-like protein